MTSKCRPRQVYLDALICDGRIIRAVEAVYPGFIRRTLDGFLDARLEPSRERLTAAVDAAFEHVLAAKAVTP